MIPVFYSYSHKDEEFKNELEAHLEILRRQQLIDGWNDRKISPGSDWEEQINFNLEKAKIILLMISSDFLASDYCYDTETVFALDQHEKKESKVVPIILRPCMWNISDFGHLQALPTDGKPITEFENRDAAWLKVAEGIYDLVKEINEEEKAVVQKMEMQIPSREVLIKALNLKSTSQDQLEISLDKNGIRHNIVIFLDQYKAWYFSPLRIVKWGGKQKGFDILNSYSVKEVSIELKEMQKEGIVISVMSKKGNPIYKLK